MRTYRDEHLDYYADRFVLLGLSRAGLTLEQYLANPARSELLGRYHAMRMDRHGIGFAEYLAAPERCEEKALEPEPPNPAQHRGILRCWVRQDTGLTLEPIRREGLAPHWSDAQLVDVNELLAQWREETEQAEAAVAHLPQRNGTIVEPLHHHRHPRHAGSGFIKRGA